MAGACFLDVDAFHRAVHPDVAVAFVGGVSAQKTGLGFNMQYARRGGAGSAICFGCEPCHCDSFARRALNVDRDPVCAGDPTCCYTEFIPVLAFVVSIVIGELTPENLQLVWL
jgi:hypothetical protein